MDTKRPDNKWDWIGSIETASGRYADILSLTKDQIDLDDIATSLSNICRFNGHLPSFYSVAEHCVRVSWWLKDHGASPNEVLTGLLHDASEAYVGDMMRPLKKQPEIEAVFKPIEDQVMKVIHSKFGGIFPHPDIVHTADYEIYKWETENIRTGITNGWAPDIAKEMFLSMLDRLADDVDEESILLSPNDLLEVLSQLLEETPDETEQGTRRSLLMEAADLVDGDRNAQYGDPIDDFNRTAIYWSTHIGGIFRRKMHALGYPVDSSVLYVLDNVIDPHDVAVMMGQLKTSRLAWDPYKRDTWVDSAGYAACGFDCTQRED